MRKMKSANNFILEISKTKASYRMKIIKKIILNRNILSLIK